MNVVYKPSVLLSLTLSWRVQFVDYARANEIAYGLLFAHLWTWAIAVDGDNQVRVSQAVRFDSYQPTVLEASVPRVPVTCCRICRRASTVLPCCHAYALFLTSTLHSKSAAP